MSKRLYRSRTDKMIAGVCAGLGQYFEIDPTFSRIVFLVLLFSGPGFVLYFIFWILMPLEPYSNLTSESIIEDIDITPEERIKKDQNRRNLAGFALIIIGLLYLSEQIVPYFSFGLFFPVLLIIVGIVLIFKNITKQ